MTRHRHELRNLCEVVVSVPIAIIAAYAIAVALLHYHRTRTSD